MPLQYTREKITATVWGKTIDTDIKAKEMKDLFEILEDIIKDARNTKQRAAITGDMKATDDKLQQIYEWISKHENVSGIYHTEDYTELNIDGNIGVVKLFFILGEENCNKRLNKVHPPPEDYVEYHRHCGCGHDLIESLSAAFGDLNL